MVSRHCGVRARDDDDDDGYFDVRFFALFAPPREKSCPSSRPASPPAAVPGRSEGIWHRATDKRRSPIVPRRSRCKSGPGAFSLLDAAGLRETANTDVQQRLFTARARARVRKKERKGAREATRNNRWQMKRTRKWEKSGETGGAGNLPGQRRNKSA